MKAPTHFAALSELTSRDFKKQAVITPKRRFDFYDDGKKCNVINWSSEYKDHVYHCLNYSNVDGKPLYFVDTYSVWGDWLCSESFRTIKEVKQVWRSQL
ncbi:MULTISPECIES: hypothetical protein [Vibrio harveyi group]|uniref:Uncharacterized protein n=1 Tax=Vibrio parahaemolyticus TaxID=670 RepID=A0AA47LA00_VIBPH|nr:MULTISPECIES: hypothetical protein [Vibrio harveyi group]APX09918.1 hypothetical protein BWP24_27270 [Vibrio campbellii]ARR10417.1 hypothetical protein Vc3S01_p30075 [Vibrio campbellii]WAT93821.1 hypothetical protein O1Q84_26925 [Vibrio parahaemolyticus]HBC3421575.1 hypothetical protein [Vibrio parahaemolyticus]HBC3883330.1 hypothetical protein [Vibrio parahaemolyticus]